MKYFRLYEDIRYTKGYNRTLAIDFSTENIFFISNSIFDILERSDKKPILHLINNIKNIYGSNWENVFEYIFLNDLGFECEKEEVEMFPCLEIEFKENTILNNLIIEYSNKINFEHFKIFEEIGCKHIEIRTDNFLELQNIINQLSDSRFRSIDILCYKSENIEINLIKNLLDSNQRIFNIVFFNAKKKKVITYNNSKIIFTVKSFFNYNDNINSINNFKINITVYSENHNYNSYFNKKLYISKQGDLKNAPETSVIFGNIKEISLNRIKEILINIENQSFSKIYNDIILVCKDCEFRYICSNNLIPQYFSESSWLNSKECNYNPFISKWRDEVGYRNLKESGITIKKNCFTINNVKLNVILDDLWSQS